MVGVGSDGSGFMAFGTTGELLLDSVILGFSSANEFGFGGCGCDGSCSDRDGSELGDLVQHLLVLLRLLLFGPSMGYLFRGIFDLCSSGVGG